MPRVDFYVDQYDEIILQKGMRTLWEEAMTCYCLSVDTGQPDFNCTTCSGSGYIYAPPKETKVLTSGLTGKFDLATIGMVQKGTAYVTALSTVLMGYHDRLTFPDFKSKYSQTVTFCDGKSTRLHRPAKKIIRCLTSVAEYIPIEAKSVEGNIDNVADTAQLMPDFKISEDGLYIEWVNIETWPADDSRAAILYMTGPSYVIDDITHELRATYVKFKQNTDTFKELPKQYSLKREDFVYEYNNGRLTSEYFQ